MRKKWKSLLSLLLAGSMCFTLLPTTGFAAEGAASPDSASQAEIVPELTPELVIPQGDTFAGGTTTFENVALGKTATASNSDADTHTPDKALDGGSTTRWATETIPAWFRVNLGARYDVDHIAIKWEQNNAKTYSILTSKTGTADADFTVLKSFTTKPDSVAAAGTPVTQTIQLDAPVQAKYIKVKIDAIDGGYPSTSMFEFEVYADPATRFVEKENIAFGKTATATNLEDASLTAAKAFDGDKTSKPSRWACNRPASITVDLGNFYAIEKINLYWERRNVDRYAIKAGATPDTLKEVQAFTSIYATRNQVITLSTPVTARYLQLDIQHYNTLDADGTIDWNSAAIYEMEAIADPTPLPAPPPEPTANVMLTATAVTTDSNENPDFSGQKAINGNRADRWASNQSGENHWLKVDLGRVLELKKFVLYWENPNIYGFKIQLSDTGADGTWTDAVTFTKSSTTPAARRHHFTLPTAQRARYVRVYTTALAPSSVYWYSASIWEFEGYQTDVKFIEDYMPTSITLGQNDTELALPNMGDSGYAVSYIGTDFEQVVDKNRKVHRPIVDTTAIASFTVTKGAEKKDLDVPLIIKGTVETNTGNTEPSVVPELREWVGGTGNFTAGSKIVLHTANAAELRPMAEEFAADYKDLFGKTLTITTGAVPAAGDFFFKLGSADTALGKEGYRMTVTDSVSVEAVHKTGAYWSTRTILQILKQNNGTTMPQGTTRDYPKFEVRGLVMDVARKPFSEKFLDDLVKNMSWYKLNDLQAHLTDNLIALDTYTSAGEDPMTAYSGFRLESDYIGPSNGVPLTNTDLFYTKEWFGNFIDNSRARGVNIVPEFDTPAHSLPFNKVRPDLMLNTDHLNVATKTNEVAAFMQGIYNEYMTGANPVFDTDTIIHIGTDEFNGDNAAKQGFVNYSKNMIDFVQNSGRTVRAWGSLTSAGYPGDLHTSTVVPAENVQLNMWHAPYGDPKTMYDLGFSLIDASSGYIVPDAGYYSNYLGREGKYTGYSPYQMGGGFTPPAGSPRVIGGEYALWNDMIDTNGNGLAQYDIYDRVGDVMPAMAERLWGESRKKTYAQFSQVVTTLGDAPNSNPRSKIKSTTDTAVQYDLNSNGNDASGNGYNATALTNASYEASGHEGGALRLNGGNSSLALPLTVGGPQYSVEMWVKKDAGAAPGEQILLESADAKIQAVRKDTGKVGFTREEYDYSFNYTLPENTWVKLKFTSTTYGNRGTAKLYVNDVWQDTLCRENVARYAGTASAVTYESGIGGFSATMLVPLERIGSKTHAFKGLIDNVVVTKSGAQSLKNLIEEAENITAANYLQDAQWDAMKALLPAAKTTLANGTPEAKATAANGLQSARSNLHTVPTWWLDTYIAKAEAMRQADYTPESWQGLQTRLTAAKAIADAPVTTGAEKLAQQGQIRNAWVKMHVGLNNLKDPSADTATKTYAELTAEIAKAETSRDAVIISADGAGVAPPALWALDVDVRAMTTAINEAKTIQSTATPEVITAAYKKLAMAVSAFSSKCHVGTAAVLIVATSANPAIGTVSMKKPDGSIITNPATEIRVNDMVKIYAEPKSGQRFVKWVNKTAGGTPSMDTFAFDGGNATYTANPLILRAKNAVELQAEFAAMETVTADAPSLIMLDAKTNGTNPLRAANKIVSLIGDDKSEGFRSDSSQPAHMKNYHAYLLTGETAITLTPKFNATAYNVMIDATAASTGVNTTISGVHDNQAIVVSVSDKAAPATKTDYTITVHTTAVDPKMCLEIQETTDNTRLIGRLLMSNTTFSAAHFEVKLANGATSFTAFTDASGNVLTAANAKDVGFTLNPTLTGLLSVTSVAYNPTTKTFSVGVDTARGESLQVNEGTPLEVGTFYLKKDAAVTLTDAMNSLKTTVAADQMNTLFDQRYRGVHDDGLTSKTTSLVYTASKDNVKLYSYIGAAPGMNRTRITFDVYSYANGAVGASPLNAVPVQLKANGRLDYEVPSGGQYVVRVYAGGYLTYESAPVTADAAVSLEIFMNSRTLVAGDLTSDKRIDTADRTQLLGVFNQVATNGAASGVYADFDDDGRVNAIDLGRLLLNYTK